MEMWESGREQGRSHAETCSAVLLMAQIEAAECRSANDPWLAGWLAGVREWLAGALERLQAPAVKGAMTERRPETALDMALTEMDEYVQGLYSSFAAIRAAHERLGSVDRTLDHEVIHALAEAVWSVRVHGEDVASLLDSLVTATDGVVA